MAGALLQKLNLFKNHLVGFGAPLVFLYFPENTMCLGMVAKYRNRYDQK